MIAMEVNDRVLQQAIELKCSECYGAMSVANRLGGSPSEDWIVARSNKLADLIADAMYLRKLDMATWKTAVVGSLLCDSQPFRDAVAKIHELLRHDAKLTKNGWYCDGVYLADTVAGALEAICSLRQRLRQAVVFGAATHGVFSK